MYKQIRISGFRGADDVVLDKLGRLNILVGRNNAGKSSCLEAISLMSSGQHMFRNAFGESALEQILGRRVGIGGGWDYIVHGGRKNAAVRGVLDTGAVETLEMAGSPHEMEEVPDAGLMKEIGSGIQGGASDRKGARREFYFYFRGDSRVLGRLYAAGADVLSETAPPGAAAGPSLFVKNPDLAQKELCSRASGSGKMRDVVSRLKGYTREVIDIQQIGGETYVFFESGAKRPISLVGDGFRSAVLLSMSSHLLRGGTMAIEGPENSTHPALMYHVVEELLRGCRDYGNQVFLATHSDELAERAIEIAPSKEYVSVFQMHKVCGRTHVESFDLDEARKHRIELGLDMRGM